MHLAVSLKFGKRDEIITAPNSFISSASSIEVNGAKSVFADVDHDLNINPDEIVKKITKELRQ